MLKVEDLPCLVRQRVKCDVTDITVQVYIKKNLKPK